jgi:hypothetical protein
MSSNQIRNSCLFYTLKNKLQLENFTGKTVLSVFQDFYACMFLSNVATFAKYITDAKIQADHGNIIHSIFYPQQQ